MLKSLKERTEQPTEQTLKCLKERTEQLIILHASGEARLPVLTRVAHLLVGGRLWPLRFRAQLLGLFVQVVVEVVPQQQVQQRLLLSGTKCPKEGQEIVARQCLNSLALDRGFTDIQNSSATQCLVADLWKT